MEYVLQALLWVSSSMLIVSCDICERNYLTASSCGAVRAMGKGKRAARPEVDWQLGLLSKDWEGDDVIRARGRNTKALTRWPTPQTKGVPSIKAIQYNADALLHLARRWCPLLSTAKSPPIPLIRAEACFFKICHYIWTQKVIRYITAFVAIY